MAKYNTRHNNNYNEHERQPDDQREKRERAREKERIWLSSSCYNAYKQVTDNVFILCFLCLVVLLLTKRILQFYFLLQTNMYICMYADIQFHSFFLNTTTAITQTLAFRRANENKLKEN